MVDRGVGDGDVDVACGWGGGGRNFAELELAGFGNADGFHFEVVLLVELGLLKGFHTGVVGMKVMID